MLPPRSAQASTVAAAVSALAAADVSGLQSYTAQLAAGLTAYSAARNNTAFAAASATADAVVSGGQAPRCTGGLGRADLQPACPSSRACRHVEPTLGLMVWLLPPPLATQAPVASAAPARRPSAAT